MPTVLNSLFTNNPDAFVYIIADDDKIDCIKRTTNIKIINKNTIPNFVSHNHHNNKFGSEMMMARLYLPKILTEDKVLYLDTDTLVLGSLDDLWNMDISDYAIAAWPEDRDEDLLMDWCKSQRKRLKKSKYVNSGVVLFNLKFIREHKIDDEWFSLLDNETFPLPDQDVMNIACDGYIKYLDTIYNFGNINYKNVPSIEDAKIYHMLNYKFWNNQNSGYKYFYLWPKYYIPILYEEEEDKKLKSLMASQTDLSIIVPCKNIENYIQNLLLSFHMINFIGIKYEILFVLDDENDPTEKVINDYMYDMNYKILYSHSTYTSMARNYGLDHAIGNYIWFVDGDDWLINSEVAQQIMNVFQVNPTAKMMQIKFVSNYFNMEHYSMVWQYVFKKDFINNFRFSNLRFQEDNDFMQRVITANNEKEVCYLPIPSYFYNYRRPGSNTHLSLKIDV